MTIELNLKKLIKEKGFLKIDEFFRFAMSLSKNSYYKSQNPFGANGDFITAPEISQLFGEMIGLWVVEKWYELGCPAAINLVELGPGRGFLMRDLLRVAKLDQLFYQAISNIILVEINPLLIEQQKYNLAPFNKKVSWQSNLDILPFIPTIFVANEFFDALPIQQFIKNKDPWYEVVLVLQKGQIIYDKISIDQNLQEKLIISYPHAEEGAILETSPQTLEISNFIANHIKKFNGAGLIIDYGYDIIAEERQANTFNSTLQGIKSHQYHSILEDIGKTDLSAHVDFFLVGKVLKNHQINVDKVISQREFLLKYGIELRKNLLLKAQSNQEKKVIETQVDRLISNNKMGSLFKVLSFTS